MAEKRRRNIDEDVLRYIFNSQFYPKTLLKDDIDLSFYDEDLSKAIGNARSYNEARNIIIDALKNESMLKKARAAADDYTGFFATDEDSWDPEKAFTGELSKVPLNVDALPYEIVQNKGDEIADALGYLNGMTAMLVDMNDKTKLSRMGGYNEAVANEVKKIMGKSDFDKERFLQKLDFTPNADDDYVAGKIAEYVDRINRKKEHENMGSLARGIQSFVFPYTEQKGSEGQKPNIADAAIDLVTLAAPMAGATKYGKASNGLTKLEELVNTPNNPRLRSLGKILGLTGMGMITGAVEPFITRGHDALDAIMNKKVYANEGTNDEVSERNSVEDALKLESLLPDVKNGIEGGLVASAVGIGGRYGKKAVQNLVDKVADTRAGKAVINGMDALFGGKKTAVNSSRKLQKEKRAIEEEIEDFYNNPKSTVSDEALLMNQKRLNEIADEEEAIRRRYAKSAANKAQNALDALTAFTVMKMGMNPGMRAKDAVKAAYTIDMLSGD